MIINLSTKIANKLVLNKTISKDEYELYIYGLFMLISQLLYLTITIIFGCIFSCIIESMIFYISFQFIRKFAGGYHASTELKCEILSTLSILVCIVIIHLSHTNNFQTLLLIMSVIASLFIFSMCPVDTLEKPLSEKEFKYFRKISMIILFAIITIITITFILKFNYLFIPLCLSLILEGLLIVTGKIKKKRFESKSNRT